MNEQIDRTLTVAAQNLAAWQHAAAENRELRLLQAEQLGASIARAFLAGALSDPDVLTLQTPVLAHVPPVSNAAALAHAMGVEEQLAFCRGYLTVAPFPLCEGEQPLPPPPAAPRVAFSDSYFSREALHELSHVLPHAIPLVAPSFASVCEELAGERSDFALLPVEDSVTGALAHILEEIDRMEFVISHTCEVPYPDENRSVTIALLSKRYRPRSGKGERLLDVSVLAEDEHTLPDLLSAALGCSMPLRRITSRSVPYGTSGVMLLPTFSASNGDVALFRAYLAAKHPRAQITGLRTHITIE